MDLLRAIGAAQQLRGAIRSPQLPGWAVDPEAFARHFGVAVEAYTEIVSLLSPDQAQLLDDTLAVNPEAAVLWILHMEPLT